MARLSEPSSAAASRRRVTRIVKHLPVYLDFLTLAVEAGLNINGALQKAVEKGPEGPLRWEFEHVLRDLKSGLNRTEALRRVLASLEEAYEKLKSRIAESTPTIATPSKNGETTLRIIAR